MLASQPLRLRAPHTCFEDLDLPETYDGIWACASLLHVKRAELRYVIARLTQHLNSGGMPYMSFKYGGGEYWMDGIYFHCLDEIGLHKSIERIP